MSYFLVCTFGQILKGATDFSCVVSGFDQSHKMKYFVIDVKSQWQGILTDIVHGCSGVTYPTS